MVRLSYESVWPSSRLEYSACQTQIEDIAQIGSRTQYGVLPGFLGLDPGRLVAGVQGGQLVAQGQRPAFQAVVGVVEPCVDAVGFGLVRVGVHIVLVLAEVGGQ